MGSVAAVSGRPDGVVNNQEYPQYKPEKYRLKFRLNCNEYPALLTPLTGKAAPTRNINVTFLSFLSAACDSSLYTSAQIATGDRPMPMSNLSNLFGRSPIKPIQEHMATAHKAAEQLVPFFAASGRGDWQEAATIQHRISDIEHEADKLKKNIRLHLPKSLFMPVPRSDLLELLSMQDQIANCAKDIAGIMFGRQMQIPVSLQDNMTEFVDAAVATSAQALKAINELDELLEAGFSGREVQIVEKLIEELDHLEHHTDELEVTIRAGLFAIETELPPVEVMFLYKVFDWVGDLADKAEKVGTRLQLLLAR